MAARRTTTRRKPAASRSTRTKKPLLTHDQWANIHGIAALGAAILSVTVHFIPQGSALTEWVGAEGDVLLVAGLLLVAVRLFLRHGHASAAGVCMAIPGALGLTAMIPWTREWAGLIGTGMADSVSQSRIGVWWGSVAMLVLLLVGLVLAVDLDVPVVVGATGRRIWRCLGSERIGRWLRGESLQLDTVRDEPPDPEPAYRDWRDVGWLEKGIREAREAPALPPNRDQPEVITQSVAVAERGWHIPQSRDILDPTTLSQSDVRAEVERTRGIIDRVFAGYGVDARVAGLPNVGPTTTLYELGVGDDVKASKVISYQTDLRRRLGGPAVRILPSIPGKDAMGIEVPNSTTRVVTLLDVVSSAAFQAMRSPLAMALGVDVSGVPVVSSLATWPHGVIAGATGSGKSVCINAIIASILLGATPDQVHLTLIDPKVVELSGFGGLPHLRDDNDDPRPIITDPEEAVEALRVMEADMMRRWHRLAQAGVKDIDSFHAAGHTMPFSVGIVDELADLMETAPAVEQVITRIGRLGRAAGVHLIVATQRPEAEVLPGKMKANLPMRIVFQVSDPVDSRIALGRNGAEALRGSGDGLVRSDGGQATRRMQGAYVSERELDRLVAHWTAQG